MHGIFVWAFLLVIFSLFITCAPRQAPSTAPVVPAPLPGEARAKLPAREGWETEWEKTLAAARKEGWVVVYGASQLATAKNALSKAFKDKFGIGIDITTGRSAENAERILSQRRAGLYLVDAINSGTAPTIQRVYRPNGIFDPLEPALILPEVLNFQMWIGGKVPWLDSGRYTIAPSAGVSGQLSVNTTLIKPEEEIKSWLDLLDPRWKGKMTINDLTIGGPGTNWFKGMMSIMGLDYLKNLAKQEPIMNRDMRLNLDWVARGKYPIGIALNTSIAYEYIKVGAPLKLWLPKEGGYLLSGASSISLASKAPHPNAARIFINWYLTREGQEIFSHYSGEPSLRVDAPTEHLLPEEVPKLGVKYHSLLIEENLPGEADQKLAAEIFGHLMAR